MLPNLKLPILLLYFFYCLTRFSAAESSFSFKQSLKKYVTISLQFPICNFSFYYALKEHPPPCYFLVAFSYHLNLLGKKHPLTGQTGQRKQIAIFLLFTKHREKSQEIARSQTTYYALTIYFSYGFGKFRVFFSLLIQISASRGSSHSAASISAFTLLQLNDLYQLRICSDPLLTFVGRFFSALLGR